MSKSDRPWTYIVGDCLATPRRSQFGRVLKLGDIFSLHDGHGIKRVRVAERKWLDRDDGRVLAVRVELVQS